MGALDEFRAQRDAVEDVRTRLDLVARLLAQLRDETDALVRDERLARLFENERACLAKAQELIAQVRYWRESEINRLWPAVWRRWALAMALTFVTALIGGVGYGWSNRTQHAEIERLRQRHEFMDAMAERFLEMTPAERQQFEALMRPRALKKR